MKFRHLLVFLLVSVFSYGQTVVDIVVNSDDHNTLEAAVIAADLAGTLSGDGPFTLFAPTDDAFAALPEGTVETLLEDPSGMLTDILLYHAVGATALSSDLSDGQVIGTINGKDIIVTINMDGVFINDAKVIIADLEADNGVVHVIDAVLLPPVSTTELPSSEANVYPSPVSNLVTVDFENNQFNNPTIYIVDNNGRAIRNIQNSKSGQVIDVADLQNGIYNIVISDAQFSITKRITKID